MQNKHQIDEETLDKIISAAYKDTSLAERLKIWFLARKNADVKRIFNEYRDTAVSIKNIPLDEYPGSLIESPGIKRADERKSFILKPAYALAIFLLVISALVSIILFRNEKGNIYSKAEIEIAEQQVKESLAIVNRVFKKTENLIQVEVFPKRVGKPLNKSLSIINEVLIGG